MASQLRIIIPSLLAIIAFLIIACDDDNNAAQTQICINNCNQEAQNAQQNNLQCEMRDWWRRIRRRWRRNTRKRHQWDKYQPNQPD